ncbi:glycosyl hydrolase family 28-related protein [Rapidithrix thailandica]|uniref:Glycosyl hydrolase family 28-related protein n=1 Tax=Rapidithrix thailandica TaxID=413964 RepID=A0AAW9SES8_9BACT
MKAQVSIYLLLSLLLISTTIFAQCLDATQMGVSADSEEDQSNALQAVIDSAEVSGACISLPAGIYYTNQPLVFPAGVNLMGGGMGTNATQTPYNGTLIWYTGDSSAIEIRGSNAGLSNLCVYNPNDSAQVGVRIIADNQLVESVHLSRVLIYGFTDGSGLVLEGQNQGGIAYASFYDLRIRHAKVGIKIEEDENSFVNSNNFFHGVISGGGFDYGLYVNGGNNNIFYGTVIEPPSSQEAHIYVHTGQIIGNQIRVEGTQQATGVPVIEFDSLSSQSLLTGFYAGGPVINKGDNRIELFASNYAGEGSLSSNLLVNAAFTLADTNALPEYWSVSNSQALLVLSESEYLTGMKALTVQVPPYQTCELYPQSGFAPSMGEHPMYEYANFNALVKTSTGGRAKLIYNSAYGIVSSTAHTGCGDWETLGLQAITSTSSPNPKIYLDNSSRSDTLTVELTAPSLTFGQNYPPAQASVLFTNGGIMTGTLSTSIADQYQFIAGTNYLVLPRNGNVFEINGSSISISRINHSLGDRFPKGTVITLLFDTSGNSVSNGAYINLKSSFTTSGANTSLTLVSKGDGTWREIDRNN